MTLMNVNPHLCDKRISKGKLGQRKSGDSELADAEDADSELGKGEYPACKLTDGNNAFSRYRNPVGTVFERYMKQRKPPKCGL